jgi:polysaccharide export outer membrane protein
VIGGGGADGARCRLKVLAGRRYAWRSFVVGRFSVEANAGLIWFVPPQEGGMLRGDSRSSMTRLLSAGLAAAAVAGLSGCSTWDSFANPSVVGRWERTPTRVPVLTHLAAIEDPASSFVELTEIVPEDLIPQTDAYRVGAGDILAMTIWDLTARNQSELIARQVDQNGYVSIPVLGRIFVSGLTETEVAEAISDRMRDIVAEPLVSVDVEQRRQQLFHLMGAVNAPGPYLVPSADYRLLEALVVAGGFPEFVDEIYVIRQVSLAEDAGRLSPQNPEDEFRGRPAREPAPGGESLLDVIEELSAPGALGGPMGGVVPAVVRGGLGVAQPMGGEPPIDLIDPPGGRPSMTERPAGRAEAAEARSMELRWRYRNGRWSRESIPAAARRLIGGGPGDGPRDLRGEMFTQRVIRVPVEPLVAGDARFNIVVRPGDVIRVPPNEAGNFYVDGQVARPGVYTLPPIGKMTLLRAITSTGGLGPLAIPERVDLTRMVGPDEQSTIMLNLRAIAEGTQPDVYIRRDDRINVGTNFWATPLAVIRGGFRTSYGFGFLLDRNFGNDVFGAPPTNLVN